jgi:hypothetical protein
MDEYYFIPMTYNFTERLYNGHIYISELANTMIYGNSLSLADNLANAITQYQNGCTPETIRNLRYWMNQAHTHGVVKIGSEVLSKLQEKEQIIFDLQNEIELQKEKYQDLEEKHAELSTRYVHLQGKYDELEEKFGRMLPKDKGDNLYHE